MVSHIEVRLLKEPPTQRNVGDVLGVPQRQFWKEALFVQYDKNKNVSLLSATIPIKFLPEGTKVLRSLIARSIKEGGCYDAWKFVACHCANGSSQIKDIDFDQSHSPVAHSDSFRINISIASMHRLTASILDVSNAFLFNLLIMKEFVSVHHPIISTDLKYLILVFFLIEMMVHFFLSVWMEFK